MIDEIFAMIMKEARARPGKDLVGNVYTVFMEIGTRTLAALNHIRDEQRKGEEDEKCREIHNASTGRTDMEASP